jgi:hypothetical protein
MTRIQRAEKSAHARKFKSKPAKPSPQGISQPQNAKLRFPHLCHICYVLTSCISKIQPTIQESYRNALRFRRTFVHSKKGYSFCTLLFQSLSADKVKVKLGKPVRFILVAPGPEEDKSIELYDIHALDLYWEGLIKPGHRHSETRHLGRFMVSAILGE